MIYSKLKYYVKMNLSKPSLDFMWTEDCNKNFFIYMNETFPTLNLEDSDVQLEIQQVFEDYFEPAGYLLFKLRNNQIRIKVFHYRIEPKNSENLNPLIDIIKDNDDLIDFCYMKKDNQILIPKELIDKVVNFTKTIENEKINKKELIKFAARKALELKSNDIVISKNGQIFIKLIDEIKKYNVSESEKDTVANRYNGIDESEFRVFYKEYFSNNENEDFFTIVAKLFVEKYFIEIKIDSLNYEKYVFGYIQQIIMGQLLDMFDNSEIFIKGFSGYVFRKHFNEVFEYIADLFLIEISISNEYIIEFLKYYSLNIVIINGIKYKVPILGEEDGLKWNVISIASIARIYIKIRVSIKSLKNQILKFKEQIFGLYIGGLTPIECQKRDAKNNRKITEQINRDRQKLDKFTDSLQVSKSQKEKQFLRLEMERMKKEIQSLTQKRTQIIDNAIRHDVIKKYVDLTREKDSLTRELKRDEKILSQNKKSFMAIKHAMAKALMSKKQLLQMEDL